MLGDFLCSYECIVPDTFHMIKPGTPIVAYHEQWGFFMQFGIFVSLEEIYYQYFEGTDHVTIRKCDMNCFSGAGKYRIYEYIPKVSYNPTLSLNNARRIAANVSYKGLFSILGDDFVLNCLVGYDGFADMFKGSRMGIHYVENRRNILKYAHHAIAIEEGFVIHFAQNEDDGVRPIHITLQKFNELNEPSPIYYKDETLSSRLAARNRALMALTGYVEFGKYNLVTNNCEHFATWCKTGKTKSIQVRKAFESIALIAAMALMKRPHPIATKIIQRYLL